MSCVPESTCVSHDAHDARLCVLPNNRQWRALVQVDLVDAHGGQHYDGHGGQDQDGGRVIRRLVLGQVVYRVRGRDDGDQDELRGTADVSCVVEGTSWCI